MAVNRYTVGTPLHLSLPLAIWLVLVIGVGPHLQDHLFKTLSNDAPSIYEASYQNCITSFAGLSTWILSCLVHWHAPAAVFAVLSSARAKTTGDLILRIGFFSFIYMSITDAFIVVYGKQFKWDYIFSNIAGNFLGALIICVILFFSLLVYFLSKDQFRKNGYRDALLGGVSLIITGLFISSSAYYLLLAFYDPVPVSVEVVTGLPIRGDVKRQMLVSKGGNEEAVTGMSLLPHTNLPLSGRTMSMEADPVVTWRRVQGDNRFDAEIWITTGCFWADAFKASKRPSAVFRDVRSVSIASDKGVSDIRFNAGKYAEWAAPATDFTFYNLSLDGKDKLKFSEMLSKEDVRFISTSYDVRFYYSVALFDLSEKQIISKGRNVQININGQRWDLFLKPPGKFNANSKFSCQSGDINKLTESKSKLVVENRGNIPSYEIGVRILKSDTTAIAYREQEGILSLKRSLGILWMEPISVSDIKNKSLGHARYLSFVGDVKSLYVNGRKMETKEGDYIAMIGDFESEYSHDASIKASGIASELWVNKRRVNQTRWETSGNWGVVLGILTSLFGAMALAFRNNRAFFDRKL